MSLTQKLHRRVMRRLERLCLRFVVKPLGIWLAITLLLRLGSSHTEAQEPLFFGAFDVPKIQLQVPEKNLTDKQKFLRKTCEKIAPDDPECYCVMDNVFRQDSGWGTMGVGKKANNMGNMRVPSTWKPSVPMTVYHAAGNGTFAKFESVEDGIVANVELYSRFYKDLSPQLLLSRWVHGGGNANYRAAVFSCF